MEGATLLLILRVLSAALLLAFLAMLGVYMQRELMIASGSSEADLDIDGDLIVETADSAERYPLRPVMSIGRNPTNTIVLDNTYTSAQHALLTWREGQWWVEDLSSRNGTWLNDAQVDGSTLIADGDIIRIGDVEIRLEI